MKKEEIFVDFEINGVKYEAQELDNGLCIISIDTKETIVSIPEKHDGKNIYSIGEYAFFDNSTIENLYIPESIIMIEKAAFAFCSNLRRVSFVTRRKELFIGAFSFYGCDRLELIYLDANSVPYTDGHFLPQAYKGEIVVSQSLSVAAHKLNVWKDYVNVLKIEPKIKTFDINDDFIEDYNKDVIYTYKEVDLSNVYSRILELTYIPDIGETVACVKSLGMVMSGETIRGAISFILDYMNDFFSVGFNIGCDFADEESFSINTPVEADKKVIRFVFNDNLLRKQ